MDRIHEFLAHAVRLEADAANGFDELADAMATYGNREVEAFFRQMADFSRKHLKQAMQRAGFRQLPQLPPDAYAWPDGMSPEQSAWTGVDGLMEVGAALDLALDAERSGRRFYAHVADTTTDAKIRAMAAEFAAEEAEHVAELKSWIVRAGGTVTGED